MNTPKPDRSAKPTSPQRRSGVPESPQSQETFPRRTAPPGKVGLANETRPGLGTRRDQPSPGEDGTERPADVSPETQDNVAQRQHSGREPNDQPLPREPQDQRPDTWAHEAERSTGVSGHMGGE